MRVLVIGSEGFIGQALVRRLLTGAAVGPDGAPASELTRVDLRFDARQGAGHAVAAPVGAPPAGTAPVSAATGIAERRIAGDIVDRAILEQAIAGGVDCVFHLASVPGGAAERNFELGLKVNLESTVSLLETLRRTGSGPTLVFASTVGVYGVPLPDGIVTVRVAPDTGLLASADNPSGIMEKFIEGNLPKAEVYEGPNGSNPLNDGDKPLF